MLFVCWSRIADRTLAGSLFRRYAPYEDAGPYKPSPAEKVARHRATDEESPFHTLFRRRARTKLAIGELAQVCLDGSTPSICYANTAKLGRTVEGAVPYG